MSRRHPMLQSRSGSVACRSARGPRKASSALIVSTGLLLLCIYMPSAHAAFPGGNGKIAFSRADDLWLLEPRSRSTERLTWTKRREGMPDWNSSGTRIAYSKCGQSEFSNCDIWVMNADGSDRTRLTHTTRPGPFSPYVQETWPTWSPDGSMIAYTSNAQDVFQDIWVMNADGSGQTRLTANEAFDAFPEWSPDGTKIAFSSNREDVDDIWVMNSDGTDPVRLTTGQGVDERPDWAPDGSRIAFSRNSNLWVMKSDGTQLTRLTRRHRAFAPAFSPNGRRIVFNWIGRDERVGVWKIRADGSRRQRLTSGGFDFAPDWQPLTRTEPRFSG